jgi:hypothetical protein
MYVSGGGIGFFVFLRPHVGCVLPLHSVQYIGPCILNDIITLGHVN